MIDPDERFGYLRWRVVALVLNLVGNAMALYGALRFLREGTHAGVLIVGLVTTALCIGLLSRPDRRASVDGEGPVDGTRSDAPEAG